MKTEIKGFLESSFLDWPGKVCSVLFLPYCNFRCPYCHNHPLVFHPDEYPSIPLQDILDRLDSFKGWIDGICLTGGEPTLSPDLPLLAREFKKQGLHVKLDTNGSNPEMLAEMIKAGEIDFVAMDVKAPLDLCSYGRSAGLPVDLNPILRSIDLLKKGGVDHQFRMTVVPGLHTEEDIRRVSLQLRAGRRLILQNFNPENPLDPSLKGIPPYDRQRLKEIERDVQGIQ